MRTSILFRLALGALVMAPSGLLAQRRAFERIRRLVDRDGAVEIGVIGGPNRNTVTGVGPADAKVRGSLGGFVSVPLVGPIRLRPELAVTGKRVGFTSTAFTPCLPPGPCPPVTIRETASFTWLEAPLLFEARFPRAFGRWITPRIYGGPFLAVRLACSLSTPLDTAPVPEGGASPQLVQSCTDPDASAIHYSNGDAGFAIGGTIAAGGVGIGFRWTRSLVPLAPDQTVLDQSRLVGAKSSTLAITVEFAARIR